MHAHLSCTSAYVLPAWSIQAVTVQDALIVLMGVLVLGIEGRAIQLRLL